MARRVFQIHIVVIAQRRGREQRQTEELVAHILRKFFAGRHGAEAIRGNQDLHLRQHLENHGDADRQLELVIALIGARYADGADHAFQRIRHDGLIGDGEQHILIDRDHTLADVLHAAAVHEQNVNGHVNLAADPGEAGTVAQTFYRQVADGTFRGSRAAAFEGDGRHGCGRGGHGFRIVVVIAAASAAGVGYLRIAGDGDFLVIQLLLLQAAVVDPLDLYADLFLQAVQRIARDGAGAGTGIGVLVRIERHEHASFNVWPQGKECDVRSFLAPFTVTICLGRFGVQKNSREEASAGDFFHELFWGSQGRIKI